MGANSYRHSVLLHSRWLETEEPRATVMRSNNGWVWHEVCDSDPETAQEIAEALNAQEDGGLVDDYSDVEQLRTALHLAIGLMSTSGEFSYMTPEELLNKFMKEAKNGRLGNTSPAATHTPRSSRTRDMGCC